MPRRLFQDVERSRFRLYFNRFGRYYRHRDLSGSSRGGKKAGATTVAIVTFPAPFTGKFFKKNAEEGIEELRLEVDTLVVLTVDDIFKSDLIKTNRWKVNIEIDDFYNNIVPDYLRQVVQCILNVMAAPQTPAPITFCDVKSTLRTRKNLSIFGKTGLGRAYGAKPGSGCSAKGHLHSHAGRVSSSGK